MSDTSSIVKCYYCGKEGVINIYATKKYPINILHIPNFEKGGRFLTCAECHEKLAKENKAPCPARYSHHVNRTCGICGAN